MISTAHYPDIDISLSSFRPVVCQGCGDFIEGWVYAYPLSDGNELSLCQWCFDLRVLIERRILELCSPPGGCRSEKIVEDLENFGVPKELTEAVRLRMHKDGRLVSS